jgi:phosphoribosyl 1,2-cyclic phosphodiesterase
MMNVTFWGVRGSIPACGVEYTQFGGHTSCVQVQVDGQNIIFDMGTGAQDLGHHLLDQAPGTGILPLHILLSHYHLDHVNGLPFFDPLYQARSSIAFYGMGPVEQRLTGFMGPPYFPVKIQDTLSAKSFHKVVPKHPFWITPKVKVTCHPVAHPGGCMAYRIDLIDKACSIIYLTDYEHDTERASVCEELAEFCKDVSLLIYDANYDQQQLSVCKGFGHSTWQAGVELALGSNAQQVAFFHHGQRCSDDLIHAREAIAKQAFPASFFARQGQSVQLS